MLYPLALAPGISEAVSAGFSWRLRFAITGDDPRTGRNFIWHFFLAGGEGGASYGFDGWSNVGEIVGEINVAGGIHSPSVEVTEERFHFLVKSHELRPDPGGVGAWCGGLGAISEMVCEGSRVAILNTAGDGVINPPFGLFGGEPGLPHTYNLVSEGAERVLASKGTGVLIKPGDRIVCLSSEGRGYGEPRKRRRQQREWDLKNGYRTQIQSMNRIILNDQACVPPGPGLSIVIARSAGPKQSLRGKERLLRYAALEIARSPFDRLRANGIPTAHGEPVEP